MIHVARMLCTILLAACFVACPMRGQSEIDRYAWQYPLQRDIQYDGELRAKLVQEMSAIIDRGTLRFRPLICRYSDQIHDHYSLYQEAGRLLQTVALAYPHLPSTMRDTLRVLVRDLFASPGHAPWDASPVDPTSGMRRELHTSSDTWGDGSRFGMYRPSITQVYAAWLYMYRSGDSTTVLREYSRLRTFYRDKVSAGVDPGNLYGSMAAHVGMMRLAHAMGDVSQIEHSMEMLRTNLRAGMNIEIIERNASEGRQGWDAPYGPEYDARKDGWIYRGHIFLNLSPELARFLADSLRQTVLARHSAGMKRFPLWWLRQAPYFTRLTGDEGVGLTSEMFGMFMPVERWIMGRSSSELAEYMRSAPIGTADCHWIESLVLAIEASGEDYWVDCRTTPFLPSHTTQARYTATASIARALIFPNPVPRGEAIRIRSADGEMDMEAVELQTLTGELIHRIAARGRSEVTLPAGVILSAGFHLVTVIEANGIRHLLPLTVL